MTDDSRLTRAMQYMGPFAHTNAAEYYTHAVSTRVHRPQTSPSWICNYLILPRNLTRINTTTPFINRASLYEMAILIRTLLTMKSLYLHRSFRTFSHASTLNYSSGTVMSLGTTQGPTSVHTSIKYPRT